MEAAKKLQLYFVGLQRDDQPSTADKLRKVVKVLYCSDFDFFMSF